MTMDAEGRIRQLEAEILALKSWKAAVGSGSHINAGSLSGSPPSGGSFHSNHGDLHGLGDDDHPQYLLVADVVDEMGITFARFYIPFGTAPAFTP